MRPHNAVYRARSGGTALMTHTGLPESSLKSHYTFFIVEWTIGFPKTCS